MDDTNPGGAAARPQFERRQFLGYAALALVGAALSESGCSVSTGGGSSTASNLPSVDNIESLRSYTEAKDGTLVRVLGFESLGDGGEGVFAYTSTTPAQGELDDNVGYVVQSSVPALAAGRWRRMADTNGVSVRWFGARGDSKSADAFPVALANQTAGTLKMPLVVPAGVYRVNGVARATSMMNVNYVGDGSGSAILADWVAQTKTTVYYFSGV